MNPQKRTASPVHALLVAAAISACLADGDADRPRVDASRRDSAGVEIVESPAPAWTSETAVRVSSDPRVRIGTLDGPDELQLFEVRFSTVLSDGRIVIANGGTSDVRFYGTDGAFDFAIGGEGDGPGEFGFMSRTFSRLPGDTLRLFDGSTRRMTEFTGGGDLVRSTEIGPPNAGDLGALFAGTFSDGRIAVSTVSMPPLGGMTDGDLLRAERTYWTLGSGDQPAREITRILEPERLFRIVEGRGRVVTLPFRLSDHGATLADLVIASTERHEVRWHTPDGRLRRIARWEGPTRELTVERYTEWLEGLPFSAERIEQLREQNEDLPLPPRVPTSSGLLLDPSGNAWLETFRLVPSEPNLWTVIEADGSWLGQVRMPDGLQLHEIGDDYVIGLWQDELDVSYVHVYDLERRP